MIGWLFYNPCPFLSVERVCPQITEQIGVSDFTFNWPATDASDIAIIQCPCRDFPDLTKDLFDVKECGMGGDWLQTEFSICVSNTRMTLCEVRMCVIYVYITLL